MSDEEFWASTFTELLRRQRCWNRVNGGEQAPVEKTSAEKAAARARLLKVAEQRK